jgi:CRP/FNR family cyclic AMP-dependent transcriptional regulator
LAYLFGKGLKGQVMNESSENRGTIFDFLSSGELGSRNLNFSDGQTVFAPGDPATDLFLTESGEIRLFRSAAKGQKTLHTILGAGNLFGLSALSRPAVYGELATSVGQSEVRAVPTERLFAALVSRGDLAVQLVEFLANQLNRVWTEESELFTQDCRARIIRKLIDFASSPAAQPAAAGVELRMTHTELAQAIGAARETVSICLMELRRENLVETRRNRVIYDPVRLRGV